MGRFGADVHNKLQGCQMRKYPQDSKKPKYREPRYSLVEGDEDTALGGV
jgi:hypothetical protein